MKIEAFKKIIREEVRVVIKEELSLIMSTPIAETKIVKKPVLEQNEIKNPVVDNIKKGISSKIKSTPQPPAKPLFESNDPLAQILNETAAQGGWKNLNGGTFNASDAVGFAGGMPQQEVQVVDSVEKMSSTKTSDINQVSIDAVPDFSGMMNTFKKEGKL
tara:strand:+ start:307 stop:786 length:480 start_codon:yes stop_codon:yes gene_type:complete